MVYLCVLLTIYAEFIVHRLDRIKKFKFHKNANKNSRTIIMTKFNFHKKIYTNNYIVLFIAASLDSFTLRDGACFCIRYQYNSSILFN